MLNTPEIPDRVPHFIQGHHLNDSLLGVKTLVKAKDYSLYLVSTVQLGEGSPIFETRMFREGGKGAAWDEYYLKYSTLQEAECGHNMLANSVSDWDPQTTSGPVLTLWNGKIHQTEAE